MKASTITIFLVFFLFFCTKRGEKRMNDVGSLERKWKAFFDQNQYEFNEFKDYVRVGYIEHKSHEKDIRVNLLNCSNHQKDIPSTICDERAIDFMNQIDIRDVDVEHEICDEKNGLNTIYFRIEREGSPQIFFIYSYCEIGHYFENSNIKYYPLNENWALQFEN